VTKRGGRSEPFDADKISRTLFAALEATGRPDPFLARELTDGVVHFLSAEAEAEAEALTTARVAELVAKVVRELGQPALAEAYAAHGRQRERGQPRPVGTEIVLRLPRNLDPADVLDECLREYTLQSVYARDIVAARADGLLALAGLTHPAQLEGCVLDPLSSWHGGSAGLCAAVEAAQSVVGRFVVLDGPEYELTRARDTDARALARELDVGLRATGLSAVVNLNAAIPPPSAGQLARGPLFAAQPTEVPAAQRCALADALFDELRKVGYLRIDWHLGPADFAPNARERLEGLARAALDGAPVAFTFDRPKQPVQLAEGTDRGHEAVLLTVGLHLPRLAALPGAASDPSAFLRKLASLARLALSAGVQKREFLRRQRRSPDVPAVTAGFLPDRARLVVAPVGLDQVVRTFTGKGLIAGGVSSGFGEQIVGRLRDVLTGDGKPALLEICVDGPASFALEGHAGVAGLTPYGPAPMRDQLRAAGALHLAAAGGTLALFVPNDPPPDAATAAECLRLAWQGGEVCRLRILRASAGR
jgi:hypothetical protein